MTTPPKGFNCEEVPKRASRVRKPKRPEGSFKKLNNKNRLHGTGYIKFNTCNLVPPKSVGVRCSGKCSKSSRNCDSISEEDRKKIFDAFYAIDSSSSQREYICRHVTSNEINENRAGPNSRRKQTNTYTLTIGGKQNKVCQRFFLATLAISEKMVRTSLKKLTDVGTLDPERRGGSVQCKQRRDAVIRDLVCAHIDRFPRIKSHDCRQTGREYLSSDLTISKMHRMYCDEQCDEKNVVSYTFYNEVLRSKNLSIYCPKKGSAQSATHNTPVIEESFDHQQFASFPF